MDFTKVFTEILVYIVHSMLIVGAYFSTGYFWKKDKKVKAALKLIAASALISLMVFGASQDYTAYELAELCTIEVDDVYECAPTVEEKKERALVIFLLLTLPGLYGLRRC
jgi:hypothetical protein